MNALPVTGERFIPGKMNDPATVTEHYQRYNVALSLVKEKTVLDIASGAGYGTFLLSSAARKAYGVEINQDAVDYSRARYVRSNLEYLQGSVDDIPLEDHSVDVVVSFETIEHVSAKLQVRMMEEIKRVLKDDGILIISSPDKKYYSEERSYVNPYHVHELYSSEFKALLEKYFSHIRFAGQRFLFGCCAIWNDRVSGNVVTFDGLTQTPSNELKRPHYLLAVAGNREIPDVFNSIVEYTPGFLQLQAVLHTLDPLEIFIANRVREWYPSGSSVIRQESSGSRIDLEMSFTCGGVPGLRIDVGCLDYQCMLKKMQVVCEDKPLEDLLMPGRINAVNAVVEYGTDGGEASPLVIPYTDDPQLLFDLPPDFAGKQCRLIASYILEGVVTPEVLAGRIGEQTKEIARLKALPFYQFSLRYEKKFPKGSRRRKILDALLFFAKNTGDDGNTH